MPQPDREQVHAQAQACAIATLLAVSQHFSRTLVCISAGISKATALHAVQEQPYTRYVSSFKKQLATSFAQQIAKDMRICSPSVAPQVSPV